MALDPRGTLLVSVPRAGRVVALPDDNRDGRADAVVPVVEGLELPHGLAFLDGQLYVAETGRVLRFDYDPATRRVGGAPTVIVPDLPARGSHWTRTIAIGPDRRLYVSGGVLVQQLRGARPPPRRDLPLRRRRPSGRAVRDGTPQRGRDRLPPRERPSSGPPSTAATGSGTTDRLSTSHGSRRAASTAGRTATGRPRGSRLTPTSAGATTARRRAGRASSIRRTRRRSGSPSTRDPSSPRSIAAICSSRSTAPGTARCPSATR